MPISFFTPLTRAKVIYEVLTQPRYIKRWSLDQVNNVMNKVDHWISHVLLTTTVNVGSSSTPLSEVGRGKEFGIPASFFYNKDAFDILFGNDLQVRRLESIPPNKTDFP